MNVKEMEEFVNNIEEEKADVRVRNFRQKETEASEEELDFGAKLIIENMVYQKVMYWVHKSPDEVSGLGNVVYEPETNTIRVIDAIMLPQKNTGTSTDIEAADVGKAMAHMYRNQVPGQLRWWWHSHVNMPVFWSGTDISTIKKLGAGGWFSATVFNKRNEMKSAFCQKDPIRLLIPEITTEISHPANSELIKQWDEEYKKNVKEKPQYSFRGSQWEWQNGTYKKREEETQEASSEAQEEVEWEELTDDEGQIIGYRRKKNGSPNKVPVERKSLQESNARSQQEVEEAIADSDLKDMASDEELARWEASSSDEEAAEETEEDAPTDVYKYIVDRDYGD